MWKAIWEWCKEEDWVILVPPAVLLFTLFVVFKLWFWVALLILFSISVLIIEKLAIKYTGLSISDQFRKLGKYNQIAKWSILSAIAFLIWAFLVHLGINI